MDKFKATLVADEADTWLTDEKSELRGIFNCSHRRRGAVVGRCDGDNNEVRLFNVFGPKVIAMIGRLPATMADRSILVELKRKRRDELVERFESETFTLRADEVRRRLCRFSKDNLHRFKTAGVVVPDALNDRAADNWRGLFALADMVGGTWTDRTRTAALAASVRAADDAEGLGVQLLDDIRTIFIDEGVDILSSEEVVQELVAMSERPWGECNHGRPLSQMKLSVLLKPFGQKTSDVLRNGKVRKCYDRRAFEDSWGRYLSEPQSRKQDSVTADAVPTATEEPSEQAGTAANAAVSSQETICGFAPSDHGAPSDLDIHDGIF